MNFRIKTSQQLKRNRIRIDSLKQLLNPNKIIDLPQQNIQRKIFSTTSMQNFRPDDLSKSKLFTKINFKRNFFTNINKNDDSQQKSYRSKSRETFNKFQNSKIIYELQQNQIHDRTRKNHLSNQLQKRETISHFRYKSLDFNQRKQIKTAKNTMWRPIHHAMRDNNRKQKQEMHQSKSTEKIITEAKSLPKKSQYLKKCSNINKKVIVNLLKLKLGQKFNQLPYATSSHQTQSNSVIRNNEILKMIKIYKGYDQSCQSIKIQKNNSEKKVDKERLKEENQNDLKNQLQMKTFPFRNINIQLSVARWQNIENNIEEDNPM